MVSMSSIMLKPDFSFLMIAAIFITIRSAVKTVIIMQNTALAGISKGSEENRRTIFSSILSLITIYLVIWNVVLTIEFMYF